MKYAPYYLLVIILLIGGLFLYLFFKKAIYLDTRMDELIGVVEDVNKDLRSEALNMARLDSQQRKIAALQIEKESYSQMINRESDRMIYFVTGLFILFSLIGFGVFKLEIFNMKEDNNTQINAAKKNQQDHKDEILGVVENVKKDLLELKATSHDARGMLFWIEADRHAVDNFLFIRNSIAAAHEFKQAYTFSNSQEAINRCRINLGNTERRLMNNPVIREFSTPNFLPDINFLLHELRNISEIPEFFGSCASIATRLTDLFNAARVEINPNPS